MNKIRLIFQGVSEIIGGPDLGLILLTDQMKERQITIVCDKHLEYQLGLRMEKKIPTTNYLPEVMASVLKIQGGMRFEILISDVIDGEYRCMLVNETTFETIPMRVSDAILFAYVSNTPIYIEYGLMMRQSVRYMANPRGMSIPINALSGDMLSHALEKAVEDENYELASSIRDEIAKRKHEESKHKGNGDKEKLSEEK